MYKELDILNIDLQIKKNFKDEIDLIETYKEKLESISKSLEIDNIHPREKNNLINAQKELQDHIKDVQNNTSLNFYIAETAVFLEKYREALKEPLKVTFTGKVSKNNKEKNKIIIEYLEISSKYIDIDIGDAMVDEYSSSKDKLQDKVVCKNCGNKKNFDIVDDNIYICLTCSAQQKIMKNVSSYKDITRINISQKYSYSRNVHFKDAINQYMGKQNSSIQKIVYDKLEEQFIRHHLVDKEDLDKPNEIKFRNITKDHIMIFLKELDYSKHYENVNLIHYNITGKKPDDISYLVDKLLDDFEALTELYDNKYKGINRKNFINTQFILMCLLRRHKHPCKDEDFSILKTIERKSFHDTVCMDLFASLGFNFTPIV